MAVIIHNHLKQTIVKNGQSQKLEKAFGFVFTIANS